MDRKKLPIGISDYRKLIEEDYYYVDKTDFIRQVIEEGSLITLLPRPRRFGKTLNLSTLRYFFEKTEGNIFRPLFNGKSIEGWKDFEKYQGKYPVIMVTLKDCKGDTFEEMLLLLARELQSEFIRHDYLREHIQQADYLDSPSELVTNQCLLPDEIHQVRSDYCPNCLLFTGVAQYVLLDEYDNYYPCIDKGY
ncbi:MAG: AAA family ATPase [Parabacteroides sp.]